MELFGRRRIYTPYSADIGNIPKILNGAFPLHIKNAAEMEYLMRYRKGRQPILDRAKTLRTDIENKVVVNNAYATVRTFLGYFLGNPIQYGARKEKKKISKAIETLNDYMHYECKENVDKEIYDLAATVGVGYKGTFDNKEFGEDEVPFEIMSLDPRTTCEVLSSRVGNRPVLTFTYYLSTESDNTYYNVIVYTNEFQCVYKIPERIVNECSIDNAYLVPYIDFKTKEPYYVNPHFYGGNPIVAYYGDNLLMGKFEPALSISDAINTLESNSLDDLEQIVQAILVFFGIPEEQIKDVQGTRTGDVICFTGTDGINQDAKYVTASLNSDSVKALREALNEKYKEIVGIPDRKTRGGGGGDTMGAVKLRDGWADIEVVARNDETLWSASEKKSLQIALNILHNHNDKAFNGISIKDIDIKFARNKNDDILTKTQSGANLFNMDVPLKIVADTMDLTSDNTEFVKAWEENIKTGGNKSCENQQKEKQKVVQSVGNSTENINSGMNNTVTGSSDTSNQ